MNGPRSLLVSAGACLALLALGGGLRASADDLQSRSYNLTTGWNAVHLDLDPTNRAVETVFAGLPIDAVWRPQQRLSSVDFIQNPNEPVWNRDRWLVYVPTNRVESLDNNLSAVLGGFSYLVRVTNNTVLNITGRPAWATVRWKPDAFNLRGFPVDAGSPPTFRDFFKFSPAHYNAQSGVMQPVYRLNAAGVWQQVQPTDLMEDDRPYWVYTSGGSDYAAPLKVEFDGVDGLDYGSILTERELRLANLSGSPVTVTLEEVGAPGASVLLRAEDDPTEGIVWKPLDALFATNLPAGATRVLRLAVQRQVMVGAEYTSILDVRDNAGVLFRVPVRVESAAPTGVLGPALSSRRGGTRALHADDPVRYAGLWVGTASLDRVSEVHSGSLVTNEIGSGQIFVLRTNVLTDPDTQLLVTNVVSEVVTNDNPEAVVVTRINVSTNPMPARAAFDLRVLIHVDDTGTPRMLKEVIQLWRDGVTETNGQTGEVTVKVPGTHVLLTDDNLLGQFKGATLRDGRPVGRRISTAHFDFPSTPTNNFLPLVGQVGTNSVVEGTYTLFPDLPTNPFKHKYHPDHDNLDATFKKFEAEAFEIVREFTFEFLPSDPGTGPAPPDYGHNVLAGRYRETVTGLHRQPIYASGLFRLQRVSTIAELNPSPAP